MRLSSRYYVPFLKQRAYLLTQNAMLEYEWNMTRSIRFNKVSPQSDLRNFQNERLVYDTHNDRFPRFARTKGRNSASRR